MRCFRKGVSYIICTPVFLGTDALCNVFLRGMAFSPDHPNGVNTFLLYEVGRSRSRAVHERSVSALVMA